MFSKLAITAVVLPAGIVFLTPLCKCLVKKRLFRVRDFYLGIDAMMAAITSALIYMSEIFYQIGDIDSLVPDPAKQNAELKMLAHKMGWGFGYCALVAIFLALVLLLHQRFEPENMETQPPKFWSWDNATLFLLCNCIGFGWIFAIIYVANH
jgi:hypothetical protein